MATKQLQIHSVGPSNPRWSPAAWGALGPLLCLLCPCAQGFWLVATSEAALSSLFPAPWGWDARALAAAARCHSAVTAFVPASRLSPHWERGFSPTPTLPGSEQCCGLWREFSWAASFPILPRSCSSGMCAQPCSALPSAQGEVTSVPLGVNYSKPDNSKTCQHSGKGVYWHLNY